MIGGGGEFAVFKRPMKPTPLVLMYRTPDRVLYRANTMSTVCVCVCLHCVCECVSSLTVTLPIDGALVEGHDVLGERARLVREDVLDLAQLLVQRGGPGLRRGVILGVVHLPVPVDVEAVPQPNDLHAARTTHPHTHTCGAHTHIQRSRCSRREKETQIWTHPLKTQSLETWNPSHKPTWGQTCVSEGRESEA